MRKQNSKKGFTIVELVITIAVIGVLTAILIPTFIGLTQKANERSDDSLVANLNKALAIREHEVGDTKNNTYQDAIDDLKLEGYLANILVTKSDKTLVWCSVDNRFHLADNGTVENMPAGAKDIDCWGIYNSKPNMANQKFSIYAGPYWSTVDTEVKGLTVGFDAGENDFFTEIEYVGGATAQEAVVRTNGGTLVASAADDSIKHYGEAEVVDVKAIAPNSYHENGKVTMIAVKYGHVSLERGADVNGIHVYNNSVGDSKDSSFQPIKITVTASVELPKLSRSAVEIADEGTKVCTIVTDQAKDVYLFNEGIYEQIKTVDANKPITDVSATWADNESANSANTQSAAMQLANEFNGMKDDEGKIEDKAVVVDQVTYTVKFNEETRTFETYEGETKVTAPAVIEAVAEAAPIAEEAGKSIEEAAVASSLKGNGTEDDPYLIYDYETMQKISNFYDTSASRKTNYFKVKDGVTTIDCNETGEGWKSVNLLGSFDGNGVTFTNLNKPLFAEVNNAGADYETNAVTVKNFTIKAYMVTSNATALIGDLYNSYMDKLHLVIDGVNVEGYIEGSGGASSYIFYGPYYSTYKSLETPSVIFNNCVSTATVVATGDFAAGFVKHGAGGYFKVVDSLFLGGLSDTKNSRGYFNGNTTTQFHGSVEYSEGFLAEHGIANDTQLYNYPANASLDAVNADNSKWTAVTGTKLSKSSQALPEGAQFGDTITINKTANATKAIVTFWIAPNDENNFGSYLGCYMSEEVDLSTGESFHTSSVRYFSVQINGSASVATKTRGNSGYTADAKTYNVVNDAYGHTFNGAHVQIVQYGANGSILSIQTVSIA